MLSCVFPLTPVSFTFALVEISWTPLFAASLMMGVMRPLSVATAIEMWIESSARGPSPDQVTFTSGISYKSKIRQRTAHVPSNIIRGGVTRTREKETEKHKILLASLLWLHSASMHLMSVAN